MKTSGDTIKLGGRIGLILAMLVITSTFCSPPGRKSGQPPADPPGSFIPDDSVKQLSQEMDRKYFPVFMLTLEKTKKGDYDFLEEYYEDSVLYPPVSGKKAIRIDTLRPVIDFYFIKGAGSVKDIISSRDKYKIDFPVDWKADPEKDRSWQLQFKSLRWIKYFIETDDPDTVLTGVKIIQDFIMNNLSNPPKNGEFVFDDMAIGFRLNTFIYALNKYLSMDISDSMFHKQLLSGILMNISFMSSLQNYKNWHNHGIYTDQALMDAMNRLDGFLPEKEIMNLAILRASEQFRYCYRHSVYACIFSE